VLRSGIVARNDNVYECFPDVARTPSGRLVCVYRESDGHVARQYSRVVVRTSDNDGESWSEAQVLVDGAVSSGSLVSWNCPRVSVVPSGAVLALCDASKRPKTSDACPQRDIHVHAWESTDDAESWHSLGELFSRGSLPDRVCVLSTGEWLLATQTRRTERGRLSTLLRRSVDQGKTWSRPVTIASARSLQLCEPSIVPLDDDTLVCYMRENSMMGLPSYKSISRDRGHTWQGPYPTLLGGCHRPVAGLVSSGDILITYRHQPGPPAWNGSGPGGRIAWARNTFAALETRASALASDTCDQRLVIMPLDHDANIHSDGGYTGWLELRPGEIFCVNYIKDNAPMAQIRWYRFNLGEF